MKSWLLLVALMAVPAAAHATTVRRAPLEELAKHSAVVFHGVVRAVDDDLSVDVSGPFRTAVAFEVLEPIKGLAKDQLTFEMTLAGGKARGRTMIVPGMPRFAEGDEVVVLLEKTARGYALTGLSQGVFFVGRDAKGLPSVARREGGVHYVDGGPVIQAPPRDLEGLLKMLRTVAAEVSR